MPELVPPIDRQYTVRFFTQAPAQWRDSKGTFRSIMLPADAGTQFQLFQEICTKAKRLPTAERFVNGLYVIQ